MSSSCRIILNNITNSCLTVLTFGLEWRNPLWFSEKCFSWSGRFSFLPDKQDAVFFTDTWERFSHLLISSRSSKVEILTGIWTKSTKDQHICIQMQDCLINLSSLCVLNQSKTMKREFTGGSKTGTTKTKNCWPKKSYLVDRSRGVSPASETVIAETSCRHTNSELHINTESVQSSADSRRLGHGAGEFWSFIHRHHLPFD